jgi:hypothetical protein
LSPYPLHASNSYENLLRRFPGQLFVFRKFPVFRQPELRYGVANDANEQLRARHYVFLSGEILKSVEATPNQPYFYSGLLAAT